MTTQETRQTLGPEERETLAALADVLIPSYRHAPSASQAGVAEEWVDRVHDSRPDLIDELAPLLKAVRGEDPAAAIERLRSRPGAEFDTLSEVVAGAYFMNPEVKKLIGYPGQQDIPINAAVDALEELTAPVVERGPIYRPCP